MARMGEERGVHRVLVGKPEGKRPLGRPRRRWEDNINTLRTGDEDSRFYNQFQFMNGISIYDNRSEFDSGRN